MAISAAVITTSSDVAWSSGDLFDGYVVFKLVPPEGREYVVWEDSGLRSTSRFILPIRAGVVDSIVKVPYNASLTPPNSKYRVFFLDKALNEVASGVGLISITATPYEVTVPTLLSPDAEDTPPALSYDPEVIESMGGFTVESLSGTKDGSNTAFTISRNATTAVVILEGQILAEGVGYTRSGTAITAVAPHIPAAGANYWAFLVG